MDEVELPELPEAEKKEERRDRLNTLVAITVTLMVTFMAICKIKDNNIVLLMQEAQSSKVDNWAWFQALNIREDINQSKLSDLKDDMEEQDAPQKKKATQMKVDGYDALLKKVIEKKEKVKEKAEEEEKRYENLDKTHEKFDLCEGAISVAVSLFAMTTLLQKRWMYVVALMPALAGVVWGALGLLS
jgi:hypothetical protein